MRLLQHFSIFSLELILSTLLVFSLVSRQHTTIRCEQLSTVFVLETSDSDSVVSNNGESSSSSTNRSMKSNDSSNTRIITDNESSVQQNNAHNSNKRNENKQNQTTNQRSPLNATAQQQQQSSAKLNQDQIQNDEATSSSSGSSIRNREAPTTSRRLEDVSSLTPASAYNYKPTGSSSSSSQNGQQQQNQRNQQQQQQQQNQSSSSRLKVASTGGSSSTTTTSSYDKEQNSSVPKTEERLLISITSEEDDSYGAGNHNKPPKVSLGGYNDEPVSNHNQQVHQHQKRKPAITISIQDANINKQNGGQGGSAVILRPGEDGQSIVIATVGTNSGGNGNYKPQITSTGGSDLNDNINTPHQINNNNNNNNDPYRDPISNPVNNPMQGIIAQHQRPISTTRRPQVPVINDPYREPINTNRPPTSTLIDGGHPQRPSQQVTDERPHRPHGLDEGGSSSSSSSLYETTHRPQRLPQPTNQGNQQQQDYSRPNENSELSNSGPRYPLNEKNCGVMHETRIVGGEEADPDDFMWMAAIIKSKPRDGEPRPFCGGSLITRRHILTAAHCLEGLAPRDVLVRLGSYDFEDSASSSSADYAIDQFRVPAQYSKKTHVADIAIMRLKTPLSPNDNYKTVCMPQPRRSYVGALGTVTGYGSQSQQFRRAAPKLRQVTVPIWENRKCSVVYKKNLTESFLCAGYEEGGKDACQGDSGGPLMTEGPEQKMMIVGVVSHGIGCGSPGYPGVYTRTSTFQEWIEKNTSE